MYVASPKGFGPKLLVKGTTRSKPAAGATPAPDAIGVGQNWLVAAPLPALPLSPAIVNWSTWLPRLFCLLHIAVFCIWVFVDVDGLHCQSCSMASDCC